MGHPIKYNLEQLKRNNNIPRNKTQRHLLLKERNLKEVYNNLERYYKGESKYERK